MEKRNDKKSQAYSRRDFLKGMGTSAIGAAVAPKLLAKDIKPQVVVKGSLTSTGEKILKMGEVSRIYKNWESGIFTVYLKTNDELEISIGGFGAIYEDIAADQMTISL